MNIKGLYRTNKAKFVLIIFLILMEETFRTLFSYLLTPAFNFLKNLNFEKFIFFILLSALVDFFRVICNAGVNYTYAKQVQHYFHLIRQKISKYLFMKNDDNVAFIQNKLNANITQLNNKFALPFVKLVENILAVLFSIGVLLTFNWSLVVLTIVLSAITLLLPKLFEKITSAATLQVTQKNEKLLDTIEKWTKGLDELRRYSSFGTYKTAISLANQDLKEATVKDCYVGMFANLTTSIFSLLGQIALIVLAAYLYFSGQISFGAVITAGNFAGTTMNGINLIAESINQMKSAKKLNSEMIELQKPTVSWT